MLKNCCFITTCKAHSKVTHIKQQKSFRHLKGRGYNKNISSALLVMKRFLLFYMCHSAILHVVIKQQFFLNIYKINGQPATRNKQKNSNEKLKIN